MLESSHLLKSCDQSGKRSYTCVYTDFFSCSLLSSGARRQCCVRCARDTQRSCQRSEPFIPTSFEHTSLLFTRSCSAPTSNWLWRPATNWRSRAPRSRPVPSCSSRRTEPSFHGQRGRDGDPYSRRQSLLLTAPPPPLMAPGGIEKESGDPSPNISSPGSGPDSPLTLKSTFSRHSETRPHLFFSYCISVLTSAWSETVAVTTSPDVGQMTTRWPAS